MRENICLHRGCSALPLGIRTPHGAKAVRLDRVLRSTRLEDSIYADLRGADEALDAVERTAGEKLRSFPALSRMSTSPSTP